MQTPACKGASVKHLRALACHVHPSRALLQGCNAETRGMAETHESCGCQSKYDLAYSLVLCLQSTECHRLISQAPIPGKPG